MFRGYNLFTHNRATEGGGIYMRNSVLNVVGNIRFQQNKAYRLGGGIYAQNSSLRLCGSTSFEENLALFLGGGMFANSLHIYSCVESSTLFEENWALSGGGVHFSGGVMEVHGYIIFKSNIAKLLGGGISVDSSTMYCTSKLILEKNFALYGGGIKADESTLRFSGNTSFTNNLASLAGGGIFANCTHTILDGISTVVNNKVLNTGGGFYLLDSSITTANISFIANYADFAGGGVYAYTSSMNFSGSLKFYRNRVKVYGGGVYSKESKIHLLGGTFYSNFVELGDGGGIYCENTAVSITGNTLFTYNSAGANGGAVCLYASSLNLNNTNTTFRNNKSYKGGGVCLRYKSFCALFQDTRVIMANNTAAYKGGAIFVEDTNPYISCLPNWLRRQMIQDNTDGLYSCFFQYNWNSRNIKITFESNTAQDSGSAIYGGLIDSCKLNKPQYSSYWISTGRMFNKIFFFMKNSSDFSVVSSHPFKVCTCQNNYPDCETSVIKRQVYPGEQLTLPVVAVGQRNGTVPAAIRSYVQNGNKLGQLQESQSIYKYCTNLLYTLPWSSALTVKLLLHVEGPCSREGNPLRVSFELLPCPIGFNLSKERVCECEPRLQVYTNSCNITDRSIQHKGDFWVGYSNESEGLILHPHCPFDYCKSGSVKFTFNETDKQCKHNRSGLLCGKCKQGLSLTFATSQCTECSSDINLLLLFVFALAGLALVFFLLIFRITVAAGTLNGLIVYANILSLNRHILLSTNSSNFLTVFMAWLNLDFGIPLCFYNGMDAYARTWLQFVFPLYIWLVIGLIILLSNFSQRIAKVFGTNPVAVLATLFLLSYTKILCTIITAVSLTFLEYPDQNKAVWLHDANIGYLEGKHIPLFLAAVFMFLIFFLPYTIVLLLDQCFQARSHMWLFSWANNSRLKAFMDAYHAPYKPRHRYWTGLLLVIRSIMFLTLGFNPNSDPSVTLLIIILTVLVIYSWVWLVGGVYKNWWLEVLESSFILNLGILAAVTYKTELANARLGISLKLGGRNQTAAHVSLSIAFLTTIGIFAYHIYLQVQNTRPWKVCSKFISKKANAITSYFREKLSASPQESINESNDEPPQDDTAIPSSSYIPLRETLLESNC